MKKELFLSSSFAALLVFLCGCAPRGETLTLEQILDLAKTRMIQAELNQTGQAAPDIAALKISLEKALIESQNGEKNIASVCAQISEALSSLIPHAGITSRAALNELATQYRELGLLKDIHADQVKLIVSRTYHTIASELETTRFSL